MTTTSEATTYRGRCACGRTVGWGDGFGDRATAERELRKHVKVEARKDARLGLATKHDWTITELTPAARREAEAKAQRLWAEHLRDRRVPDLRRDVGDKLRTIAGDLAKIADGIVRHVSFLEEDPTYPADRAVEGAQHDVLWGVANLGLDRLISRLRDLDAAERELAGLTHLLETKEA